MPTVAGRSSRCGGNTHNWHTCRLLLLRLASPRTSCCNATAGVSPLLLLLWPWPLLL
jgi:hypothetical protein